MTHTFSRRSLLKTSTAAAALIGVSGCAPKAKERTPIDLSGLLTETTDFMVTSYPASASSAGIDTGKFAGLKSKLSDRSPEGQAKIAKGVKDYLAKMDAVDTSLLSADDALNLKVIRTVFDETAKGFDLPYGDVALLNSNWSYRNAPYAVAQNVGAFVEVPSFMESSHSLHTDEDADAYLERMKAYAGQLDGESERTRIAAEKGVLLPDFLMKKTIGQMKGALARPEAEWSLVKHLAKYAPDKQAAAEEIAKTHIRPALKRQMELHEKLAPNANSKAGIWAKPDGDDYYKWALKASTTTTLSPDEVHQMGLDELAELQAEMDPILRSIGYTEGTVGARMTALGADKRYHFSDGDKGRAEIMDFIHAKIAEIRTLMPDAFETQVPGFLEVTRISPDVEAGAPGAYGGAGSVDGKKPGHYWINLRTPALHNKFSLADLTYHEAIPGHVWQGEYTFKQPLIRSLLAFNAYSEGWALYAQQIAAELGVYDDFPVGKLGYLQSLAFRACRLVVDTGLHAKQWTREQAIDWFVTNNGSSREEVAGEIDRYCSWPGQACGYKVGHTAINRLRNKSQKALGGKYDFKRFNDAVVLGGSVPMTVLGEVIDDYIARDMG